MKIVTFDIVNWIKDKEEAWRLCVVPAKAHANSLSLAWKIAWRQASANANLKLKAQFSNLAFSGRV